MKTTILLFFAIIFTVIKSQAQCFVLKVNITDCALCSASSSAFNPQQTGLPAFVIYPTSRREDSTDINYAGKFSEHNIKMLFNDNWNEKLTCDNSLSCVFGLNKDGKIVYTSSLKSLSTAQLDTFLLSNKAEQSVKTVRHDSLLYTQNNLGVIKIHDVANDHLVYTIRVADFDLQLLANKMSGVEKQRFEKYGTIINKKTSAFLAQFTDIQFSNNGDLFVKLLYHTTYDSLTSNIVDEHAIVHYNAIGNYKDVYLIEKSKAFIFKDRNFLLANEDTFYAIVEDVSKRIVHEKPESKINFIGRFIKNKGMYRFNSYVPYNLPYIQQLKFEYNYLSSSSSYYPLFTNKFSNSVYNIKTNKSVFIIDSAKYITGIDTSSFDPQKSIETHEKLNVFAIRPVFGKPNLYSIPYIYDNKLYINYYTDDLVKTTFYWGEAKIGKNRIVSVAGRAGQDIISIVYVDKDKTWKSVALPATLFLP